MKKITGIRLENQRNVSEELVNKFQEKLNEFIGLQFDEVHLQKEGQSFIDSSMNSLTFQAYITGGPWKCRAFEEKGKYKCSFFSLGAVHANVDFEFIME